MSKKVINVGIIGSGRMGKGHAENLSVLPEVHLTAVSDINYSAAEELASKHGIKACKDEQTILKDSDVDAVIIATPTPFHSGTAIIAAKNGKSIFCEKPLAMTIEEGLAIKKAVEDNEVTFGIGFTKRYSWPETRIKELLPLLGEAKAGRVTNIFAQFSRHKGDWFTDFKRSGGYTIDSMVHFFDAVRWFFGEAKTVSGKGLLMSSDIPEPMDYTFANIEFTSGMVASLDGGWIRRGVSICSSYYLIGTEGTIYYDGKEDLLKVFVGNDYFEESREKDGADPMYLEIETFIRCLINQKPFSPSVNDGIEALRMALGIVESIKTGKTVRLETKCSEMGSVV